MIYIYYNLRFLLFPITKKKGQKKQIYRDEVKKKKKKRIRGVSFVDWSSFKTNKRVILFCREIVNKSRNLNQHKSRNLLFLSIYYFNLIFNF